MNTVLRLGFLSSHGGSNMQAIIDACKAGILNAVPSVVISNNSKSTALARAKREGVPRYHMSEVTHPENGELDQAILETFKMHEVNLVILAGYMKLLEPQTTSAYRGRILNIHPALLPNFGGKGLYGMAVHKAVLAANEKNTGITIHLVDERYDHGPIVAQIQIPVLAADTIDSLSTRVLKHEHKFFVETLQKIENGELDLHKYY